MNFGLLQSIILLPGTVLIFIPGILLWLYKDSAFSHDVSLFGQIRFWVGIALLLVGISLAVVTVRLQLTLGKGTPAPWDPPKELVVAGPYQYVRNPMITGVLILLTSEWLILGFWPIVWWMFLFLVMNMVYFPLFEEKDLEKRFGEEYLEYKRNVPRWFPRISPWRVEKNK